MKHWIAAARLRTLPLAMANIIMGGVLAAYFADFSWGLFGLTVLTALALQILSNFANDYGDHIHGADHINREGPSRAVQSGQISASAMKRAMVITGVIALVSGLALLLISPLSWMERGVFVGLGLVAIWAAINYTAGDNPYGYRAMGDVSVFLFFGVLAVVGGFYVMTGVWEWTTILPAISCGVFSMAVLNINNIRDIDSDVQAGKRSLAIKLGRDNAVRYHLGLLTIGVLCAMLFTYLHFQSPWQWLFMLTLPLFFINYRAVLTKTQAMELDPYLKQMALSTLLFVVTFSVGLLV